MSVPDSIRYVNPALCIDDLRFDLRQRATPQWLQQSIEKNGVLSPLTAVIRADSLHIISGFCRLHTAIALNLTKIPVQCLPSRTSNAELLEICLQLSLDNDGLPLAARLNLVRTAHQLCTHPREWLAENTECLTPPIRGDVYTDFLTLENATIETQNYFAAYDAPLAVAMTICALSPALQKSIATWALKLRIRPIELRTIIDALIDTSLRTGKSNEKIWRSLFPENAPDIKRSKARRLITEKLQAMTHQWHPARPRAVLPENSLDSPLEHYMQIFTIDISADDSEAQKILSRAAHLPVTHFTEKEFAHKRARITREELSHTIVLTHFPGSFAKACPGTRPPGLCCKYEILSPVMNCPIGCSYCILQSFLSDSATYIYTDAHRCIEDAATRYAQLKNRTLIRTGTGELGDSLVLEPWTQHATRFIKEFREIPRLLLEIKTKTADDAVLSSLPVSNRCVLSWSVNPQEIIDNEEGYAASLSARLAAARKAAERGFLIGFHCDPIIAWENGSALYANMAQQIVDTIPEKSIAWISAGCLRYPHNFPRIARAAHPHSHIFNSGMIQDDDKWRYPPDKRIALYSDLLPILRKAYPSVFIYLCMETPDVWNTVMPWTPQSNTDFDSRFNASCLERFPQLH